MFETLNSFQDRSFDKKIIIVEYTGCEQHLFVPGKIYKIIAKPAPLKGCYENIHTSPEPDKIIVL